MNDNEKDLDVNVEVKKDDNNLVKTLRQQLDEHKKTIKELKEKHISPEEVSKLISLSSKYGANFEKAQKLQEAGLSEDEITLALNAISPDKTIDTSNDGLKPDTKEEPKNDEEPKTPLPNIELLDKDEAFFNDVKTFEEYTGLNEKDLDNILNEKKDK